MANYLGYCATSRLKSDQIARVLVPSGGLKSGNVVLLKELADISGNYEVFVATQPATSNLTEQDFAIVVPQSYETLSDGRRPGGQPDFTQYEYVEDEIATVVRIDKNLIFFISPDNVTGESETLADDTGKYLIPANATNDLAVSQFNTTVGNSLKILGVYDFPLGGNYNSFVTVYEAQAQAKANAAIYTVSFDANGGTGTIADEEMTEGYPTALTANTFTYTGHTFLGWSTTSSGDVVYDDEESITPTADMTLYAIWEQIQLGTPTITLAGSTISWDAVTSATSYSIRSSGTEVTTTASTSKDLSTVFTEDGDYVVTVVATASGFADSVASNSVNYSIFTITFNANGGTGTMADLLAPQAVATALTANTFTYAAHTFSGWSTTSDGEVEYADEANITATADTTLYAIWTVS